MVSISTGGDQQPLQKQDLTKSLNQKSFLKRQNENQNFTSSSIDVATNQRLKGAIYTSSFRIE